jgi:hypothetical protein|tara:strand:+ start:286 stop:498 length:213 start_codon:yes stop_codon:yes gene_type:complete
MALSTVDTNQIANGKVKNEDMVASTSTNPFRSNATSIDTDLTIASTENAGCFGPITVSATITINGVLTIV